MARRYFPGRSPLGQIIQNPHGKSEVVGVVADVRNQGLARRAEEAGVSAAAAEPDRRAWRWWRAPNAIRCRLATRFSSAIWSVDPEQPIYQLSTMEQILARAVFLPRLSTTLLAIFAAGGAAACRAGDLRRAVVFRDAAHAGDRAPHGARFVGRKHGRARGAEQPAAHRHRRASPDWPRPCCWRVRWPEFSTASGPSMLPSFSIAAAVLIFAGVAASVLPAVRATRVDPMVALRDQ